jgi:5'-methylthioadenosine phosphorylase
VGTKINIGVIGGSGLYKMPGLTNVREMKVDTPFGDPSDVIIVGDIDNISVAFIARHGQGHVHLPSEVPYLANIYALKKLGVQKIISVSACGSLREYIKPGDIVIPDQVFDFTKCRKSSFFGKGLVAHVSVANPYCPVLSQMAYAVLKKTQHTIHQGGSFITIEGPRFSTKAESHAFRAWGMDIIGMTASPEVFLAREAGMCYVTIAHVTDYDVWHESEAPVTVEMVIETLNANVDAARTAIQSLVPLLEQDLPECDCSSALTSAILTAPDKINPETRKHLQLLTDQPKD